MEHLNAYNFLKAFFELFKAKLFDIKFENNKVFGIIEWQGEEEKQSFSWENEFEDSILINIMLLCEYLVKYDLNNGDKITIPEYELQTRLKELGWSKNEAESNINHLCSIEVKMIDEGVETDSFFVHF